MIFNQNGVEFGERKIPVWNVQTHFLLTSNDAVFQILIQIT